jgi:hypothetical protein
LPALCQKLRTTSVPRLIAAHFRDGKYTVSKLSRSLANVAKALSVVFSHLGARVEKIGNVPRWIAKNTGKVCVVLFTSPDSSDDFIDFRFAAAHLADKCVFASASGGADWNISLYRAAVPWLSTVVKLRGRTLINEIGDRSSPLFLKLSLRNYAALCGEWCLGVVSNNVSKELLTEFHDLPFNTVQIDAGSDFARKLNGTANDWLIFLGNHGWRAPPSMDRNSLFVILWELWKTGNARSLIEHVVDVPFLSSRRFW